VLFEQSADCIYAPLVSERDEHQEAVRNVEKATDSEPVKGEDLLESETLKRQLREAKARLESESH
jgi:transcriptional regulator of met regulon